MAFSIGCHTLLHVGVRQSIVDRRSRGWGLRKLAIVLSSALRAREIVESLGDRLEFLFGIGFLGPVETIWMMLARQLVKALADLHLTGVAL